MSPGLKRCGRGDGQWFMGKVISRSAAAFVSLPALILLMALVLIRGAEAQTEPAPQRWVYIADDFSGGSSGWLAAFSDYSLGTGFMDRVAEVRPLPANLESGGSGYYLRGRNTPDDLFMFLKKPLTAGDGIVAGGMYDVEFFIEVASNAPSNCAGIGGAPGESVWLKAGASKTEPVSVLEAGTLRMNVDKGGQSGGGADATVVSNIANGIPCEESRGEYVLLRRYHQHANPVEADESGTLWVFLGTDSGFEGITALYYARVIVLLTLRSQ